MNFEWLEADLENWEKNKRKSKDLEKLINSYIITQREKDRYLEIFGKLPEEFRMVQRDSLNGIIPKQRNLENMSRNSPKQIRQARQNSQGARAPKFIPLYEKNLGDPRNIKNRRKVYMLLSR
jgi:hypothetical protein